MSPQLIIALCIAGAAFASGFGSAWEFQSLRMDRKEKEHVEQELADERQAAETRSEMQRIAARAVRNGVDREVALRASAAGASLALIGLSGAVDTTLRDASTSLGACTDRATTLGGLLIDSERDYIETSAKAGRHASDVKTCHDAVWGK